MSRYRSRSAVSPLRYEWGASGGKHGFVSNVFSPGSPLSTFSGNNYYSALTDDVTSPGQHRSVIPCSHTRNLGALFSSGQQNFVGYENNAYKYIWCKPLVCHIMYYPGYVGLPALPLGELLSSLVSQCEGAVQNGALLGVSLSELSKTIKMVRNPFNIMRRDWRKIAQFKPAQVLMKESADLWLEHRYGWNALYGDLKSFAKASAATWTPSIVSEIDQLAQRYSASTTLNVDLTEDVYSYSTLAQWNSLNYDMYPYNAYTAPWVRVRPKGKVTFRLGCRRNTPALTGLKKIHRNLQAWGLTTDKVLPTLWEVLPYSFVVDWFVNSDEILVQNNLRRLEQLRVDDLCSSSKLEIDYMVQWRMPAPHSLVGNTGNYAYVCDGCSYVQSTTDGHYSVYNRYIGTSMFESFRSALLNANLSSVQLISGLALCIQSMFGKK